MQNISVKNEIPGFLLGKILGNNAECGFGCDISDLGWAEYLILLIIFIVFFIATRKVISYIKNRNAK